MSGGPEWFAPRRYGYGAGLPISWQGWAVLLAYIAAILLLSRALGAQPHRLVAALALPTILFLVICARTTRGGWRWRWGDDD